MNTQWNNKFELLIAIIAIAAVMGTTGGLADEEGQKDSSGQPGETKTVKGKIVPLYTFLTGEKLEETRLQDSRPDSRTDRIDQNQPSETRSGRFDTKPSRNQASSGRNTDGATEDRERQRNSRNLGSSDPNQSDSSQRGDGIGENASRTGRPYSQWRAMNMNAGQPLALVASDDRHFEVKKECYLLIFDPQDDSSERALLQARRLAMISGLYMRDDFNQSTQRDRIDSRASAEREDDRIQVRDRRENEAQREDSKGVLSTGLKQEVSVTGRVIEKDGVQAMVVSSISNGTSESPQIQDR